MEAMKEKADKDEYDKDVALGNYDSPEPENSAGPSSEPKGKGTASTKGKKPLDSSEYKGTIPASGGYAVSPKRRRSSSIASSSNMLTGRPSGTGSGTRRPAWRG